MGQSFAELRATDVTAKLPPAELQQRVADFLQKVNICVLCTARNEVPRATPIEFYAEGTTLYMTIDPGTKTENLRANPRVSIGISSVPFTDWTDWQDVKGLQITGLGMVMSEGDPGYSHAQSIYRWQHYAAARGWDLTTPPKGAHFLKVLPDKIEYRDLGLLTEGYAATQVWERQG